jgi:hypothetical protein
MEHELKYDEENEVAVLTLKKSIVQTDLDQLYENFKDLLASKPYRQLIIVMGGEFSYENRETREASTENFMKMNLSEIAFVGLSAANRMIAKVLMKTGKSKLNGDFFKSYEEATKWLKSKR